MKHQTKNKEAGNLKDIIGDITDALYEKDESICHLEQLKNYYQGLSEYHEREVRKIRTALTKTKYDLQQLTKEQPNLTTIVNYIDSILEVQTYRDCEVTITYNKPIE